MYTQRKNTMRRRTAALLAVLLITGLLTGAAGAEPGTRALYDDDRYISAYAKDAVYAAYDYNIMHGTADGTAFVFRPLDWITREEVFRVVYALKNAGQMMLRPDFYEPIAWESSFTDKEDIAGWALGYAGYCIQRNIFMGDGAGRLHPKDNITYFEFAIVLLRIMGYTQQFLEVMPGESITAWKMRVVDKADSFGLFDGVLFYQTGQYDNNVLRQDIAVMAMNVLSNPEYTLFWLNAQAYDYVETGRTVEESNFGKISQKSGTVIAAEHAQYVLADGTVILTPDRRAAVRTCLGRTLVYLSAEGNRVLSWNGQLDSGDQVIDGTRDGFYLRLQADGTVHVTVGAQSFAYPLQNAPTLVVFAMGAERGETVSPAELTGWIARQTTSASVLRFVFNTAGQLCAVRVID